MHMQLLGVSHGVYEVCLVGWLVGWQTKPRVSATAVGSGTSAGPAWGFGAWLATGRDRPAKESWPPRCQLQLELSKLRTYQPLWARLKGDGHP